jgi:deoxyribose-phosphate aldolase
MTSQPEFAAAIDYTLLKPTATAADFAQLYAIALARGYKAVCVPPNRVASAADALRGSNTLVCSVLGFPLGYSTTDTKVAEAHRLIQLGARELDLVWQLGAFLGGELHLVEQELQALRQVTRLAGVCLKVILESGQLNEAQLRKAAELCLNAQVDFVKTSTGFMDPPAELDKVQLLRDVLPSYIQVKASGGIRTRAQAEAFLAAGASRIGTSADLLAE